MNLTIKKNCEEVRIDVLIVRDIILKCKKYYSYEIFNNSDKNNNLKTTNICK